MTPPALAFLREVDLPEARMNLARAALLVAKQEYPQLQVEAYLGRLDLLAEEARNRLADETAPLLLLEDLRRLLFERHRFRGNREEYYDPRNSFLSDVLDRRAGIPLTLGIVLLEVGWRLGLPLEGVNFPGHFLVRYAGEGIRLLLDPFEGGRIRFEDEAQSFLDRGYGGLVRVRPEFLGTAGKRAILVRLLTNLKGVYLGLEDHARALAVVDHLLAMQPDAPAEIRTRGSLLARLGRTAEARSELERYLDLAPSGPEATRVRALLTELRDPNGRSAGG